MRIRRGQLRAALFDVEVDDRRYEMRLSSRERKMINVASGQEGFRSTGRHYKGKVDSRVELSDCRTLHFPARTTGALYAAMSALDESGRSLIEYRIQRHSRVSSAGCNSGWVPMDDPLDLGRRSLW